MIERAFTCLIPALGEAVVYVGRCRAADFDIGIVPVSFRMTRCADCLRGKVDPSDERHFRGLSRVDQPTLLVMEVMPMCAIPANTERRSSGPE